MLLVLPPFLSLRRVEITLCISHLLEVPVPRRLEGTARVRWEEDPSASRQRLSFSVLICSSSQWGKENWAWRARGSRERSPTGCQAAVGARQMPSPCLTLCVCLHLPAQSPPSGGHAPRPKADS